MVRSRDRVLDFECSYKRVDEYCVLTAHYSLLSPDIGGLESGRLLLLGAISVTALALVLGDDNIEDRDNCGADFVLLGGFGSCEDIPSRCTHPD